MNRHTQRQRDNLRNSPLVAGHRWSQRVDPMDSRFVIVEFRFPIPNGEMSEAMYSGLEAKDRILRFCKGYLGGEQR